MALYIHNREFAIDFGIEYPQGDVVLEYGTVYHYGGHCGRELCGISLLGTLWKSSALYILTEDVALEYGTVDIYWGRCATEWHCRYLVGALR